MKRKIKIIAETQVEGSPVKVGKTLTVAAKLASTLVDNHKAVYVEEKSGKDKVEKTPALEAETKRADEAEEKFSELSEHAIGVEKRLVEVEGLLEAETKRADEAEEKASKLDKELKKLNSKIKKKEDKS